MVCDGFVRHFSDRWLMWYCFGTNWVPDPLTGRPERTYKITAGHSEDGVNWRPGGGEQIIPSTVFGDMEAQALPAVIASPDGWEMVFCYRHAFGFRDDPARGYQLGYAQSSDGHTWARNDSLLDIPHAEFDSEMRCYPHIVRVGDRRYVLFNGNAFGRDGFGIAEWREGA